MHFFIRRKNLYQFKNIAQILKKFNFILEQVWTA